MAHIASRTECCEFVIIVRANSAIGLSLTDRLQADGDAVTDASDRVVITGRLGHVYVTSLGQWLTRLTAYTC